MAKKQQAPQMTVEQIRAQVEAAKVVAMARFKRDWGTDDAKGVIKALCEVAPGSSSVQDMVNKGRALHAVRQAVAQR